MSINEKMCVSVFCFQNKQKLINNYNIERERKTRTRTHLHNMGTTFCKIKRRKKIKIQLPEKKNVIQSI